MVEHSAVERLGVVSVSPGIQSDDGKIWPACYGHVCSKAKHSATEVYVQTEVGKSRCITRKLAKETSVCFSSFPTDNGAVEKNLGFNSRRDCGDIGMVEGSMVPGFSSKVSLGALETAGTDGLVDIGLSMTPTDVSVDALESERSSFKRLGDYDREEDTILASRRLSTMRQHGRFFIDGVNKEHLASKSKNIRGPVLPTGYSG